MPEATVPVRLTSLLLPYRASMALLIGLTVASSALGLAIPQVIAHAIDTFTAGRFDATRTFAELAALALGAYLLGNALNVIQTVAAERVARDLRERLTQAIAQQSYATIERLTPARLLTNLTSDVDAIKLFVAQSAAAIVASAFTILAAGALLLWLDWQLALAVLAVLPIIGTSMALVMRRVRKLFGKMMAQVDALNRVLNENIVGAALIRLLDTGRHEFARFIEVNGKARAIGLEILRNFAIQMPITMFLSNVATLTILLLGGWFVIEGRMTLGEFTAFNAYLTMLIFPVIIIGFASMSISQAQASLGRLSAVLDAPPPPARGDRAAPLTGAIEVDGVTLAYGERRVLDAVSFGIAPGTRTAIAGPTAAGKSQLLYLMAGLLPPDTGRVLYDGHSVEEFARASFHDQIGLVFQDSRLFNLTVRENIAFNSEVDDIRLHRAIETAELREFIAGLPDGLETIVSERGTSLSGGQKQRIMLARALALEPRVLFLDDFTARVDVATEGKILANIARNYPELTLVSITQKLAPVRDYDQIILLMDGEIVATGKHDALLAACPEYVQLLRSQESTEAQEAA